MVQKVYENMSIPGDGHPFNLVELVPTDNLGAGTSQTFPLFEARKSCEAVSGIECTLYASV